MYIALFTTLSVALILFNVFINQNLLYCDINYEYVFEEKTNINVQEDYISINDKTEFENDNLLNTDYTFRYKDNVKYQKSENGEYKIVAKKRVFVGTIFDKLLGNDYEKKAQEKQYDIDYDYLFDITIYIPNN